MKKVVLLLGFVWMIISVYGAVGQYSDVDTLRDALTNPSCQRACWLGIEPGVTTPDELETILTNHEITFTINENPLDYPVSGYTLVGYSINWWMNDESKFPYAVKRFDTTIAISGGANGIVGSITTPVAGLSITNALTIFDAQPDIIVDDINGPAIVYREIGLVFDVILENPNEVYSITLATSEIIDLNLFDVSYTEDIQPCTEPAILCTIPTHAHPVTTSFTLINADNNTDIGPLTNDQTVDIAITGTANFKVRANTNPATVGSVVFTATGGPDSTDSDSPYLWNILSVGSYALTATPYSEADGTGTDGTPLTVSFNVVNSSSPLITDISVTGLTQVRALAWNPTGTVLATGGIFTDQPGIRLYNSSGQFIRQINTEWGVNSVSWSPNNEKIAAYLGNYRYAIWNANTGIQLASFDQLSTLYDLGTYWNPAGNRLVTVEVLSLFVRDPLNGNILQTITIPYQTINCSISLDISRTPPREIATCNLADLNDESSYLPIAHPQP